jgi:hypothetical protein
MDNRAVGASYCKAIDAIEKQGRWITFWDEAGWALKPWVTSHKLNRLKFLLELYATHKINNIKEILKIEEKLAVFRPDELAKSMSASVACLDLAGNEERGAAAIHDLNNKNNRIDSVMAAIAEKISTLRGVPLEPPMPAPVVPTTGSLNA